MGSITEHFSNLSDRLLSDYRARPKSGTSRVSERDIFISQFLRPFLPGPLRVGTGQLLDAQNRSVGVVDVVGCWDAYPPMGQGDASLFLADGVVFCLQVRNWTENDLTDFGRLAERIKALDRKTPVPIFCGVVSFEPLAIDQVSDFLKGPAAGAIDGVLSLGQHAVFRNTQGLYGDPRQVPFVSERGAAESLKAFAFLLLNLSQTLCGQPFRLTDYQHL